MSPELGAGIAALLLAIASWINNSVKNNSLTKQLAEKNNDYNTLCYRVAALEKRSDKGDKTTEDIKSEMKTMGDNILRIMIKLGIEVINKG